MKDLNSQLYQLLFTAFVWSLALPSPIDFMVALVTGDGATPTTPPLVSIQPPPPPVSAVCSVGRTRRGPGPGSSSTRRSHLTC